MLKGSQPEGDLGPQGSWSPLGMAFQMWTEGSCLDLPPGLTRNLFLLVHSFRVSDFVHQSVVHQSVRHSIHRSAHRSAHRSGHHSGHLSLHP